MAKIQNDKYYTSPELAKYCVEKTKEIIGENNITEAVEKRVAQLLSETPETATIEHDLLLAPVWVRNIIKRNIKTDSSNE